MAASLRCVPPDALVVGWDFGTQAAKAIAFDLAGNVVAECRARNELYTEGGVTELDLGVIEHLARDTARELAARLRDLGRLDDWLAAGVSATHHTSGRIDADARQVRRAICWNDQTLRQYHPAGLARLGGQEAVTRLIGGPWAERYSLSHLVKDGATLPEADWKRTRWVMGHGPLAAGYLTGRFGVTSVSSAASTGIMNLETCRWQREMLGAIERADYRDLAWNCLPQIVDMHEPIGPLSDSLAREAGIVADRRPLIFPTLDDQAAGLAGAGAVGPGEIAVILGTSAVVNSSSDALPQSGNLDAMRLNWPERPYLWMRCYSNGAEFFDSAVGRGVDLAALGDAARGVEPLCNGTAVLPFLRGEPSVGVREPRVEWTGPDQGDPGTRARAAMEAIAYLIALGIREHRREHARNGQEITRVTVSGGMANSDLMCEILASVLEHPLDRLQSNEGSALGAAVAGLAGLENHRRAEQRIDDRFAVADAVGQLVRVQTTVAVNPGWVEPYRRGLAEFERRLGG
jgi:sugar (pentulose or hexulose) kinase